jgi:hypothetical protein
MEKSVPKEGRTEQLYANRNAAREAREKFYSLNVDLDLSRYPETRWMLLFEHILLGLGTLNVNFFTLVT